MLRGFDVLAIGFVAWRGPIIPVAIEHRAIGKAKHMTVSRAGGKGVRAIHPVVIFGLKLRKIVDKDLVAVMSGDELDHGRKEGRLGAAQIIAAIAVGHVTVPVDQRRYVLQHVERERMVPVLLQSQHDEVGVPIVDSAEPAARDDVRPGQGQKRRVGPDFVGLALQHLPHVADVVANAPIWTAFVDLEMFPRRGKVKGDEGFQVESGQLFLLLVVRHDLRGRLIGNRVGEGLLIREQTAHLDCTIEFAELH